MEPDEEITGAIDTSEDNYTPQQAAPQQQQPPQQSAGMLDMGPPPYMRQAAQETAGEGIRATGQLMGQQMGEGVQNVMKVPLVKRIYEYLTGDKSVNPAAIDSVGREVDPQGQMSPADRNLYGVSHVKETTGDDAAWQLMQAHRVAYNAKTAFAKQAMTGNEQKPANLHAALQAANEAQTHVLDGSNVVFALHNGQVTATVTSPGSKEQQHLNLSPQQFAQFLDVGHTGQYDRVLEESAPMVLQRLVGSQQQAQAGPAPQQQQQPQEPQQTQVPVTDGNTSQPGKVTRREYQPPEYSGDLTDEQAREKRSYAMFPRAHLDVDQNAKREEWLNSEGRADTKEAIEGKKADHQWSVESARVRAAGGVEAARVKAEGSARQQQARALEIATKMMNDNKNQQMRENGRNARAIIGSQNWLVQTDAERENVLKKFGINAPMQVEAAPAAPAAPAGAAKPTEDRREYKGKMYTREEYERDVLGKH